jgi:hypothetical protein
MAEGTGADPGGGWDISNWLDGFEDSTVQGAVAKVLRDCKEKAGAGTRNDLDWCRELAEKSKNDPALVAGMLQPITEQVAEVLRKQLGSLDPQEKNTAAAQNDRFIELGGKHMNFGTRDDFDKGLEGLIGIPGDDKVYPFDREVSIRRDCMYHSRVAFDSDSIARRSWSKCTRSTANHATT